MKDNIGTHKVIEQKNGITVKILEKPSSEYRKKMTKNKKIHAEIKKAERERAEREKLIQDKIRELAIQELEKEGKI